MHPQSCIIEEVAVEEDVQESSSARATRHSLEPSAEAAQDAAAAEASSSESASKAAAAENATFTSAAGEAVAQPAAAAESQAADAAPSSSSGSDEQQDPQLQQLIADCERLKQEGNVLYAQGEFDGALQLYWQVTPFLQTFCS
jgi:hypothetical protein